MSVWCDLHSLTCLCHLKIKGINLCEVGPTDCHTNATCLDRDGGYDCECNDGYTGNGTYCEGRLITLEILRSYFIFWQMLMNVLLELACVIVTQAAPTLWVVIHVNVFLALLVMDGIAQVSLRVKLPLF